MSAQAISSPPIDARVPRSARVRARLRGWRLDTELARGADPSARPELAARAAWLRSTRQRRQLAAGLEHIVRECDRRPGLTASPPVHRPTIRAARSELLALAADLKGSRPLATRGIAMVRRLLVEDTTALHIGGVDELREALSEIHAALAGAER